MGSTRRSKGLEAIVNRSRTPFRRESILRRRKLQINQSDVGELNTRQLESQEATGAATIHIKFRGQTGTADKSYSYTPFDIQNLPLQYTAENILVTITGWDFRENTGRTEVLKNGTKETLDGMSQVTHWLQLESKQVRSHLTYLRFPENEIRVDFNGEDWERQENSHDHNCKGQETSRAPGGPAMVCDGTWTAKDYSKVSGPLARSQSCRSDLQPMSECDRRSNPSNMASKKSKG